MWYLQKLISNRSVMGDSYKEKDPHMGLKMKTPLEVVTNY